MAALPDVAEDLSAPAEGSGIATPTVEKSGDMQMVDAKPGAGTGGGGGKKKKKGKK